jgi:hypothetical protein
MMIAPEFPPREEATNRVATKTAISPSWSVRAARNRIALSAAVAAFSTIVLPAPSYGDTGQIIAAADPVAGSRVQDTAPTDAESLTCKELKDRLASSGSLMITSGARRWGDTFHGPRVPQCEFWQRPVFSYVRTRDELCGVGYICVEKFGSAGGTR